MIGTYIDINTTQFNNFYNFIDEVIINNQNLIKEANIDLSKIDIDFFKKAATITKSEIFDNFEMDNFELMENDRYRYFSIIILYYKLSLFFADDKEDREFIEDEISFHYSLRKKILV